MITGKKNLPTLLERAYRAHPKRPNRVRGPRVGGRSARRVGVVARVRRELGAVAVGCGEVGDQVQSLHLLRTPIREELDTVLGN